MSPSRDDSLSLPIPVQACRLCYGFGSREPGIRQFTTGHVKTAKTYVHEYFDPGLLFALHLDVHLILLGPGELAPVSHLLDFVDISFPAQFRTRLAWDSKTSPGTSR